MESDSVTNNRSAMARLARSESEISEVPRSDTDSHRTATGNRGTVNGPICRVPRPNRFTITSSAMGAARTPNVPNPAHSWGFGSRLARSKIHNAPVRKTGITTYAVPYVYRHKARSAHAGTNHQLRSRTIARHANAARNT